MRSRIDPAIDLLACPVCGQPLDRDGGTLGCPAGHCFDIARQGQVNLLNRAAPANADSAQMLAARARFLAGGHFLPIAEALRAETAQAETIIECGAGTGYYLAACLGSGPAAAQPGRFRRHLASDVSPAAARRCATLGLAAVVADTWGRLPVLDQVADALLCIFAPKNPAEFARILRPGGRLLIVTPNADHLAQLRADHDLLQVPTDKFDRLSEQLTASGFALTQARPIERELTLDENQVDDLIGMGPNAFHRGHRKHAAARATSTRLSVMLSIWMRAGHTPA